MNKEELESKIKELRDTLDDPSSYQDGYLQDIREEDKAKLKRLERLYKDLFN